jgi:hypothetical protein
MKKTYRTLQQSTFYFVYTIFNIQIELNTIKEKSFYIEKPFHV